jgi:hypothetical protein
MSARKLQTFDEYPYGKRGVLKRGEKFRVSRGPYYVNEDGSKSLMAERGTFVFKRYCTIGSQKWIEAKHQDGGDVVLWVGKEMKNPLLQSFRRRPYTVRKVGETTRERKKAASKGQKKAPNPASASKRKAPASAASVDSAHTMEVSDTPLLG